MNRWIPLLGTLLFVGIGFGWRTYVQWRRYGSSGVVLFRSGDWRQHAREGLLLILPLGLLVQAVALVCCPAALAPYVRLPAPAAGARLWLGSFLLCGGTALMALAQLHLGAAWRIGIDRTAHPGLVTGGLYRVSRNPIFLAMFISLAGFALLVPSWLSLALVSGTALGVRRQVEEEEAHLRRTYGEAYRAYATQVGRFLPGVGRLR
jgi:protein-S-isoprenylcysteine O-methyltransferase Ste14